MESVSYNKETKKFVRTNSDVSFDRKKQPGKYEKTKIRPLRIRYDFPFKRYLINRVKFCINIYSKIVFVRTVYVRFLCL